MPNRLPTTQTAAEPTVGCAGAAERFRAGHDLRDRPRATALAIASGAAITDPRDRDVARDARPVPAIPDRVRSPRLPSPAADGLLVAAASASGGDAMATPVAPAATRPIRIHAERDVVR